MLWFAGLSGAGKPAIANAIENRLHAMGRHTCKQTDGLLRLARVPQDRDQQSLP